MSRNIILSSFADVSISPNSGGGVEKILGDLDRSLFLKGYGVNVAGLENSKILGKLLDFPISDKTLSQSKFDFSIRNSMNLMRILNTCMDNKIDLVHSLGGEVFAFSPIFKKLKIPVLMNFHTPPKDGIFDFNDYEEVLGSNTFFSYVSNYQKSLYLKKYGSVVDGPVIYNGINMDEFIPNFEIGTYLLSMSRITPGKGINNAIELAKANDIPLNIAGRIYSTLEDEYYTTKIEPILSDKINYLGLVSGEKKINLYQKALANVCMMEDEESFCLSALESLACGTPVIAYKKGPIAEFVIDGKTGLLVKNINEAKDRFDEIYKISPKDCRESVEYNFNLDKMVSNYISLYDNILRNYN